MIKIPVQPHPIEINVNDTDNSTAKSGVNITIRNTTKKSTLTTDENGTQIVTDSNGVALVDLANLPLINGQTNEYDQGDIILIIADDGVNHDAARYIVVGEEHTQQLNLNPVRFVAHQGNDIASARLQAICAANTSSSVYEVKVYAVADGSLLCQLECAANVTTDHVFGGERGKGAPGGFVVERENTAVVVTVTFK